MSGTKVVTFVLVLALVLCIGCKEVTGRENNAPWISQQDSRCCREHPELGRCLPGIDDSPENNGKCWAFCVQDCEKGGFCKLFGNKHKCHCYC